MTESACRCMLNGWTVGALSGRKRWMACARNAARACWIRWNFRWRSSWRQRPRVNWPPRLPLQKPATWRHLHAIAPRVDRRARPCEMQLQRWHASGQAGGRHHRDTGSDFAAVEGDPDGAGEIYLPRLRAHPSAAGAVPCHPSWLGQAQSSGHDHVREIRPAPTAEPPDGALRARRQSSRRTSASASRQLYRNSASRCVQQLR